MVSVKHSAKVQNSLALSQKSLSTSSAHIYGILLLGIVCIAFSAIFITWAQVPGSVAALYSVAIPAIVLAPLFTHRSIQKKISRNWLIWALAAGAGIFFSLDLTVWSASLTQTSAANATLLGNDSPIIVGIGALLIFRERLGISYWAGLMLALLGIGVIIGNDTLLHSGWGKGDLLALLSGVFYAIYLLATQHTRSQLDTLSSLWLAEVSGTILLLLLNLIEHKHFWALSLQAYLALLGLGLISQTVGWLSINYALGHLRAANVSVMLLGQPILTAFLAVIFLGQILQLHQIIGGAITLLGIYFVDRNLSFAKRKEAKATHNKNQKDQFHPQEKYSYRADSEVDKHKHAAAILERAKRNIGQSPSLSSHTCPPRRSSHLRHARKRHSKSHREKSHLVINQKTLKLNKTSYIR